MLSNLRLYISILKFQKVEIFQVISPFSTCCRTGCVRFLCSKVAKTKIDRQKKIDDFQIHVNPLTRRYDTSNSYSYDFSFRAKISAFNKFNG